MGRYRKKRIKILRTSQLSLTLHSPVPARACPFFSPSSLDRESLIMLVGRLTSGAKKKRRMLEKEDPVVLPRFAKRLNAESGDFQVRPVSPAGRGGGFPPFL